MAQFEKDYIERTLKMADGERRRAAEMLGISRKNLWEKMVKYGLHYRGDDGRRYIAEPWKGSAFRRAKPAPTRPGVFFRSSSTSVLGRRREARNECPRALWPDAIAITGPSAPSTQRRPPCRSTSMRAMKNPSP
jgi:hypothetical protein